MINIGHALNEFQAKTLEKVAERILDVKGLTDEAMQEAMILTGAAAVLRNNKDLGPTPDGAAQ